ncbi:MAG: O-antigen ligase family protein [Muribaculaceae bacterium]|nr:O-antigen ligase family protein [Muribaculaceae bacterium]
MISLITRTDPVALFSLSENGSQFINHESRQRIVSLFIYPFDYGYASLMLLLFMMYAKFNHLLDTRRFYIALGCAIFGIFFCGCRTVMVTSCVSLAIFFFFHYSLIRFGWYILLGAVAIIGAYSFSPKVQKTVDVTMTAFDPEAKMEKGGSSTLKDRTLQYLTTYDYARKNIWLGRGYRFFENDLGYNKNGDGLYSLHGKARNLLGLEGVMMRMLLERGIIGILAYCIFYILLFRYLSKLKKYSNLDASFGIATLVAFICYGNMTGELGSAIITFIFAGIYMKSAAETEYAEQYSPKSRQAYIGDININGNDHNGNIDNLSSEND